MAMERVESKRTCSSDVETKDILCMGGGEPLANNVILTALKSCGREDGNADAVRDFPEYKWGPLLVSL